MDELKHFRPKTYIPPKKKVDKEGFDEDGVLHDKCGTDDCCNSCETSEEFVSGYDTMPDTEDLERIVDRELNKLKDNG